MGLSLLLGGRVLLLPLNYGSRLFVFDICSWPSGLGLCGIRALFALYTLCRYNVGLNEMVWVMFAAFLAGKGCISLLLLLEALLLLVLSLFLEQLVLEALLVLPPALLRSLVRI